MPTRTAAFLLAALAAPSAFAAEPLVADGGTAPALRDLAPDRPDTTESPITVDQGHWQLEASLATFSRDKDKASGDKVKAWSFPDLNLKYGVTAYDDVQLVFSAWAVEDVKSGGATDHTEGVPDVTVRWKHNFWGNDGGETAFALMPFLSIPSGSELSSDHVEGGLIAPLGWTPAWAEERGMGFAFMLEGDVVWDAEDTDYDFVLVHTATCGFDVAGPVGAFVEYIGEAPSDGDYTARFSCGVTCSVDENLLLDVGARIGLNDAAEDLALFTGFTLRH